MASALDLKRQGNDAFNAGNYKGADTFYTRAIQRDPEIPALFTNRANTRIKLQAWDGCMADALKALDLFPADDRADAIKMKAYYYLAQAQLALKRPGEGLSSAQRAYEMCIALSKPDAQQMASLVLRAKKEKWEVAEGERQRRGNALLRETEDALRLAREQAEAALEERFAVKARVKARMNVQDDWNEIMSDNSAEYHTTDEDNEENEKDKEDEEEDTFEEERAAIRTKFDDQVRALRHVFATSTAANTGNSSGNEQEGSKGWIPPRRDVPDYLIDSITFAVMYDPVITKHGHSYERATIEAHLRTSQTDPLTRDALTVNDLRPNLALKHAAAEFLQENGWAVDW